jgi:hypothetical protein
MTSGMLTTQQIASLIQEVWDEVGDPTGHKIVMSIQTRDRMLRAFSKFRRRQNRRQMMQRRRRIGRGRW